MSSSRHPILLPLERRVGGATKLLATVMLLPLIDGIFPALVLAGALDSPIGIIQTGLLVFGGSATLAVIVAEMDNEPRKQAVSVLAVGVPLIVIAGLEAALAPTIESLLDLFVFERFAALVMAAVAAKTASATIGEYLPSPSVIIGLGMIASLDLASAELALALDPGLVARASATGAVGVAFALGVVALQPYLRVLVDIDRFRFGSAVALGTLALSIGVPSLVPSQAPLPVFVIAGLLAIDPSAGDLPGDAGSGTAADGGEPDEDPDDDASAPDSESDSAPEVPEQSDDESGYTYPGEGTAEERAPWL